MANIIDNPTALVHENETKIRSLVPLVRARKIGVTWKNSAKRRQTLRPNSRMSNLGLHDDIGPHDKSETGALNGILLDHFAILAGRNDKNDEIQLEFVEKLLKQGANIDCKAKHGQGLLHEVAGGWDTDVASYLLNHEANVNIKDNYGITPLHVAAAEDYPEMINLLIENGAKIEAKTKQGQTPLHFAARNDAVNASKALVDANADKEAKDKKERTPLFLAAVLGRSDVAKYLINVKADVTVVDKNGQFCLTYMIMTSESAARLALDQYHKQDRVNREEFFRLHKLEVSQVTQNEDSMTKSKETSCAQTPLEVIVRYQKLDLIVHPVIKKLVDVKWEYFGRKMAFQKLLLNLSFVLIWTILGVVHPWNLRPFYTFPQDAWRIIFLVVGCSFTIYEIYKEVKDILASRNDFKLWKAWRKKDMDSDIADCVPKWKKEKTYHENQKRILSKMLPIYFHDVWNYFDWIVYFLIFMVVILHIADASLPTSLRQPPCCTVDFVCNDTSVAVCNIGVVNNLNLSVWNNRFFVFLIIFLWLRIMKFTRAFRFLGPFMVMLEKLTKDILRFLYLYGQFYVPYACGFWMIFGNVGTILSMSTVDRTLFSLFRITLVDEYQYDEMHAYDKVMAYILIGTFLGISAILCLNLFIALLSYTFLRVYENAKANSVMQRAASILNFEENLNTKRKKKFREYLKDDFDDENRDDDYSTFVTEEENLRKMTIQMKNQLDELMEIVRGLASNLEKQRNDSHRSNRRMRESHQPENKSSKKPLILMRDADNDVTTRAKKGRNDKIYEKIKAVTTGKPKKGRVAPIDINEPAPTFFLSANSSQGFGTSTSSSQSNVLTSSGEQETDPTNPTTAGVRITELPDQTRHQQA